MQFHPGYQPTVGVDYGYKVQVVDGLEGRLLVLFDSPMHNFLIEPFPFDYFLGHYELLISFPYRSSRLHSLVA